MGLVWFILCVVLGCFLADVLWCLCRGRWKR